MKIAVVLLNLGGPDSLGGVQPFLFRLFNDKAILRVPQPLRALMALFISIKRWPAAKKIYAQIGGRSPIRERTEQQAKALQTRLGEVGEYKVFISMRYAAPLSKETVREVKAYGPDKVILLPLYPQFSTTTTQSSFSDWYAEAKSQGLHAAHHPICCYPSDNHFIEAQAQLIKASYDEAAKFGQPRVLFSAHGLPEKIIEGGDPYQWQIERTVSNILRKIDITDHAICYQSRVGPLTWIGPSTHDEVVRAARARVPIVMVPISFVSEHSETLVELDIEYHDLARENGGVGYGRVPAVGIHPEFIETLAWMVEATRLYPTCSNSLGRICPKEMGACGFKEWSVG